tara:strand:+ start:121 stop:852 length:732 start_codon:yes stop_codon:yes gene_type:complete
MRSILPSNIVNNVKFKKDKFLNLNSRNFPSPVSMEKYILMNSFNGLPIDLKNDIGFPTRCRRYANYIVDIDKKYIDHTSINYNYTGKQTFIQNVNDDRKNTRKFECIEKNIRNMYFFDEFLKHSIYLTINNSDMIPEKLNLHVHQIRQICYPYIDSHNSPEGIHKDGSDFIISAYVINRSNIVGGESMIYDNDKKLIHKKLLHSDNGIFQDDKDLYHYVTPIQSVDNHIGYRDILGIDIDIIS